MLTRSFFLYVCLLVGRSMAQSLLCLSVGQFAPPSFHVVVYLSVSQLCLSVCLSRSPPTRLIPIYLRGWLSLLFNICYVYLSANLSVYQPLFFSVLHYIKLFIVFTVSFLTQPIPKPPTQPPVMYVSIGVSVNLPLGLVVWLCAQMFI